METPKINNEELSKLQQNLKQYILLCREHKILLKNDSTKEQYTTFVEYFKMVSTVLKKEKGTTTDGNETDPVLEKNMKMLDKKLDQLLAVFDQF
ncbi:MAG: hypothetical protein GY810_14125 [Aureispira sp.]|nr:hypothetical protein [Aureispira sp.]